MFFFKPVSIKKKKQISEWRGRETSTCAADFVRFCQMRFAARQTAAPRCWQPEEGALQQELPLHPSTTLNVARRLTSANADRLGPQAPPHTELAFLAKWSDARKAGRTRELWRLRGRRRRLAVEALRALKVNMGLVPVFQCQNKRYFDEVFHPFLDWYFSLSLRRRQGSLT